MEEQEAALVTAPLGVQCPSLYELQVVLGPIARWWQVGRGTSTPRQIVIHTTESDLVEGGASNVAKWLSRTNYRASSHFIIDSNETLLTVDLMDTAWGVGGAPNASTIQIELVGSASASREDWLAPDSARQLCRAAALSAQLSLLYDIPLRLVEAPGLLTDTPGVAGHDAFSEAYKISDHTDPGAGFPWDAFLAQSASYLAEAAAAEPLPTDWIGQARPDGPKTDEDTENSPLPVLADLYKLLEELEGDFHVETPKKITKLSSPTSVTGS